MASVPAAGLSARGPRECATSAAQDGVRLHGGEVPYYNIKGEQHYRVPHKDKGQFANVRERCEWTREPNHRTRTELLTARRGAKHPDITYDIDGDGAVGPVDYFISKQFSREEDHRLNTGERGKAVEALENGWLDKYSFGHEQAGAKRPFPVCQKRGMIVTVDNIDELNQVYPPHWNADTVPNHPTKHHMELHRKAELVNAANKLKDSWDAKHPKFVPEPEVHQENLVADPPITHISQRREAMRQLAREEAGLHHTTTGVNPHKEDRAPGCGHRHKPEFATRTELNDARRARIVQDLEDTRIKGETDYIPANARHTCLDAEDYHRRRPNPDAMTHTKLKQRRKAEDIEYNMANFTAPDVIEFARYEDQAHPWWKLRDGYAERPPKCLLKELSDPGAEVAGKVTATSVAIRNLAPTAPLAVATPQAPEVAAMHDEIGHGTIKRWTSENVPVGLQSQVPRLFDGVRQAPTYSTDSLPMHHFSSFEVIRNSGKADDNSRQHRTAREDEERAEAWRTFTKAGPSGMSGVPSRAARALMPGPTVPSLSDLKSNTSSRSQLPLSARTPSKLSQRPRMPPGVPKTEATGDDPPMTERLDRIVGRAALDLDMSERGAETPRSAIASQKTGNALDATAPAAQRPPRATSSTPGAAAVPVPVPPAEPRSAPMVVRSSAFQWLDRQKAAQRIVDDSSSLAPSLRPTPRSSARNLTKGQSSLDAASRSASRSRVGATSRQSSAAM